MLEKLFLLYEQSQRATGVNHNTWGKELFGGGLCLLTAFLFITVETAKSETWILNVGQVPVFFHLAQQEIGLCCLLSEDFVHWLCLPLRPLEFLQIKKEKWNETEPPRCWKRWTVSGSVSKHSKIYEITLQCIKKRRFFVCCPALVNAEMSLKMLSWSDLEPLWKSFSVDGAKGSLALWILSYLYFYFVNWWHQYFQKAWLTSAQRQHSLDHYANSESAACWSPGTLFPTIPTSCCRLPFC